MDDWIPNWSTFGRFDPGDPPSRNGPTRDRGIKKSGVASLPASCWNTRPTTAALECRLNFQPIITRCWIIGVCLISGCAFLPGCQSQSNPWAGEPYQDPVTYRSPPHSIYAPMPSILPSIDGTAIETDESLESELDLLSEGR